MPPAMAAILSWLTPLGALGSFLRVFLVLLGISRLIHTATKPDTHTHTYTLRLREILFFPRNRLSLAHAHYSRAIPENMAANAGYVLTRLGSPTPPHLSLSLLASRWGQTVCLSPSLFADNRRRLCRACERKWQLEQLSFTGRATGVSALL